jgi:bifunctional non-homologous end joining protein LigD
MMLPLRPCLPTRAPSPPAGPDWLHEIKHDGFRMLAVRNGAARLISRHGRDRVDRFPAIVAAVQALAVRTCILDGEIIASDGNGIADFEALRYRRRDAAVTLVAFDLIEVDGRDLRREPIETRKLELARVLTGCRPGVVLKCGVRRVWPDRYSSTHARSAARAS